MRELVWSASGERLLAVTARRLVLYGAGGTLLVVAGAAGRHARRARGVGAARDARRARALGRRSSRSEVVVLDSERGLRERPLFDRLGRFGAPAWSPDGRWLLVPWPAADQWLFLPAGGGREARPRRRGAGRPRTAVANIARQFAPGAERGAFPPPVRWCCPRADVSRW